MKVDIVTLRQEPWQISEEVLVLVAHEVSGTGLLPEELLGDLFALHSAEEEVCLNFLGRILLEIFLNLLTAFQSRVSIIH